MNGYKDFPVTSGKPYNISFELDRSGIANFNVEIYTSATVGGTTTLVTTITNPANGLVTYTFTPPSTPAPAQNVIRIYFKKNSGENTSFYIDNLQIRTVAAPYAAVVVMKSDYYPFGMQMPGRHTNDPNYRYGYNGMEKDAEMHGEGNSYTTEFRQYDPRLGRWLSLDPLMHQFPWMSPYVAFNDNPVYFTDPLGLKSEGWIKRKGSSKAEYDSSVNTEKEAKEKYGDDIEFIPDETVVSEVTFKGGKFDEEEGAVYTDVTLGYGGIAHQGGNKLAVVDDLADNISENLNGTKVLIEEPDRHFYDIGLAAELANKILNHPNISLVTIHPNLDYPKDNANADDNIRDVANRKKAKTSSYSPDPKEPEVYLSISMLEGILKIAKDHKISIQEFSGADHSKESNHYLGISVDINKIDGTSVIKIVDANIVQGYVDYFYSIGASHVISRNNDSRGNHNNHFHLDFNP